LKRHTTSERLKQIMNEHMQKQVDILNLAKPYCDKYNVKLNRNDLSQYVNGKVEPKQTKLSILGLALNVNEAWLMGYDVPIYREPAEPVKPAQHDLTPRQERIVELFDELTEPQQDNIIGRAELLAEQNENESAEEGAG